MKLKSVVIATMLALSASSANAGNFFQLTEGAGGVLTTGNGGLKNGVQNANADPFYIITTSATYLPGLDISNSTGDIVASVLNYQTFNRVGTTTVSYTHLSAQLQTKSSPNSYGWRHLRNLQSVIKCLG